MVNVVHLIGNLGKDPQLTFTPQGKAVCKFSIATSERWTTAEGEKKEKTEWHNIVVWGKQAEACGTYLAKGGKVYIEGKITNRSWDGNDGQKHYITEIVARNVRFLSMKPKQQGEDQQEHEPAPADDDIPF